MSQISSNLSKVSEENKQEVNGFLESSKSKFIVGVGGIIMATASQAALTAPDFTDASADVTTVVAVIAFLVTLFGFKKIMGLLQGR